MKKYNLIQIFGFKELIFWKRTINMHTKFKWVGKLLVAFPSILIIAFFHYAFALMHFLFECFLYISIRSQFNININKMRTQIQQ